MTRPEVEIPAGLEALSLPVRRWFREQLGRPTEAQARGWPAIAGGGHVLISAPTGSGKTLAAFLLMLDRLVRQGLEGSLEDRLEVVYVSPMRALSHDVQRNLKAPLAQIRETAAKEGLELPDIRVLVRTGDTPGSQRTAMTRRPPQVLVTTPESLYLLVTAERSREMLRTVHSVVVDEIHALAGDRRGAHLALTLERLAELAPAPPQRIGLSATAQPLEELGDFLTGRSPDGAAPSRTVIDLGHRRTLDLEVMVPEQEELQAVASREQWDDLLDRVADLIREHRTTLVFVSSRRLAERVAHRLGERLGEDRVCAHHGSLSKERRLQAEQRLKHGDLDAMVATASLELGIDIGYVDLVCQLQSPRSIAAFLQRVGRSGHSLGRTPKGRLFPTSRDELVECAALVRAVKGGRLDRIRLPDAPLDVLAQQIVAACATGEQSEEALFKLVRRAHPYRDVAREDFDAVLAMLADGFETPAGRRGRHIHRDRIQGVARGRRGARLAALTSGGTIPDTGEYRVVLDPDDTLVGTVDEDWAVESMAGDIFLLGTHTWQIRRVESGVVRVVDAGGAPPTVPFWFGEGPGRTEELSEEVSALREEVVRELEAPEEDAAASVRGACNLEPEAAAQVVQYVKAQAGAVGVVPGGRVLLAERFFDESGGMQLVLHSPRGMAINRGLGLLLRKRLCRSFNQELQAAATDDAVVISLANPQTFDLDLLPRLLRPRGTVEDLTQALLGAPMFGVRWRWNAGRSLAVLRHAGGRPVPFHLQRMRADDLLAAAFPDQTACQEHVTYPVDVPDHPLVQQTLRDCLHQACDLRGLQRLLEQLAAGSVELRALDTIEPSPFAHEILNAKPFAFLDDAPLEERRTRAVSLRHALPAEARDLGKLDTEAIDAVRAECAPDVRTADDLHELLDDLVLLPAAEAGAFTPQLQELCGTGRAGHLTTRSGRCFLVAAERLLEARALHPDGSTSPGVAPPRGDDAREVTRHGALEHAVRGRLMLAGPVRPGELAALLDVDQGAVESALGALAGAGVALAGHFDPRLEGRQHCDRALLARIHRRTLGRLRREIEPVTAQDLMRFLLVWQRAVPERNAAGEDGLMAVLTQLSGWSAPMRSWEQEILALRVDGYSRQLLDRLCLSGRAAWGRLDPGLCASTAAATRATPMSIFPREDAEHLLHVREGAARAARMVLREPAERILDLLELRGALFRDDLRAGTGLLEAQVEQGLMELVARGLVTSDGFAPLRRLVTRQPGVRRRGRGLRTRNALSGRWVLLSPLGAPPGKEEAAEAAAFRLLRRYGVVFRDLLAREDVGPGWRAVHRALRRLEARGEVRGGRFVSGFTGEQFALPDAVPLLRSVRREPGNGLEVVICAADPLNLAGILTPGPKVPAGSGRKLVIRDGLPRPETSRSDQASTTS